MEKAKICRTTNLIKEFAMKLVRRSRYLLIVLAAALVIAAALTGCEKSGAGLPGESGAEGTGGAAAGDDALNGPGPDKGESAGNGQLEEELQQLFAMKACALAPVQELAADSPVRAASFALPVEQRTPLGGIKAISVRKLEDEASYGFEFGASFALNEQGKVFAWGLLHNWSSEGQAFPRQVEGLPGIQRISGLYALDNSGHVWFMGEEGAPRRIEGLADVAAISDAGNDRLAAVTADGMLWLWAPQSMYMDGKDKLVQVKQAKQVKAAYGDLYGVYWIDRDGLVWKVRLDWELRLEEPVPVALPDGAKAERVDTTFADDYVLTTNGSFVPVAEYSEVQTSRRIPDNTVKIAGTHEYLFYLNKDGTVWGEGTSHRLFGLPADRPLPGQPMQIAGIERIVDIQMGSDHVLALAEDGMVYAWGSNMYGQLGAYPHFFDTFTPIAKLPGVQHVWPSYDELRFVHDGDVYRVNAEMKVEPVLLGRQVVSVSWDEYLTVDGAFIVSVPGEACYEITSGSPIVQVIKDSNGWVALLESGDLYKFERWNAEIGAVRKVVFPDGERPGVVRMYGYPLFMVLSEDGHVYYMQEESEHTLEMKRLDNLPALRDWSTTDFVFFDGIGSVARALDHQGRAYRVMMKYVWNERHERIGLEAEAQPLASGVKRLHGGLLELEDGRLIETAADRQFQEGQLPPADRPNLLPPGYAVSSVYASYAFPIEGWASYRHVLVAADGTMMANGHSPFFRYTSRPAPVLLPGG